MILLDYPEKAFYYVTAVCTVDLEMPNSVAAERTVARLSMMYAARSQARSSIFVYKYTTPHTLVLNVYEGILGDMCRLSGRDRPSLPTPAGSAAGRSLQNKQTFPFFHPDWLRFCSRLKNFPPGHGRGFSPSPPQKAGTYGPLPLFGGRVYVMICPSKEIEVYRLENCRCYRRKLRHWPGAAACHRQGV